MNKKKLATATLREAALKIAEQSGLALKRDARQRRKQAYIDHAGQSARLRTTNDRTLTVSASSTRPSEATLDFDECDVLLVAMPTERRGISAVEAYWIPAGRAARDIKTAHQTWFDGTPDTRNDNKTYSIWFDEGVSDSGMFRESGLSSGSRSLYAWRLMPGLCLR